MSTQVINVQDVTSDILSEVTFIVDFSGSVSPYLSEIGSKIFEATKVMDAETYNVLYFSGRGQFGMAVAKYKRGDLSKKDFVNKFKPIGMTYFREVLEVFARSNLNKEDSLMVFITDGQATEGNIEVHDEACKKIATEIKSNTLWIAVGDVNLDFFKEMSRITGGAIEHFDAMEEAIQYVDTIKDAKFKKIELPSGFDFFYEIVDNKISIINGNTVMTDTVYGVKIDKDSSQYEIAAAIKAGKFVEIEVSKYKKHLKFLLAQNLTTIARDSLANSIFKNDIVLLVRPKISPVTIFQLLNYLVKNKAIIDRVQTLSGYKKNSKSSGEDSDGWQFDSMSEISDIVYNKERLNVNIGLNILGIKQTPDGKTYETKNLYKLYTVIQDGTIKIKKIFIDQSEFLLKDLKENDIPFDIIGDRIVFHLDIFPIISNTLVEDGEISMLLTNVISYEEFLKKARAVVKSMNPLEEKSQEESLPKEKKVYTDSYEVETLTLDFEKDKVKELREYYANESAKYKDQDLVDRMKDVKSYLNEARARLAEIRAICALTHVVSWQGINVKRDKKTIKL